MAQLVSTAHSADIPPVPHQGFIADTSKPFDTVIMIGYDHYPEQIEFLIITAEEAAKEGKNTLIIGDGKSDIPTNYTELLQGRTNGSTQIILFGHGEEINNHHCIDVVERQEDVAHTVQDIASISGENPPHRVFVFSCHAEAAKANFLKTQPPVEVILDGSHNPTLLGLNLEAISILIRKGHLPYLSLEGDVNQHTLYDHVTIIGNGNVITHVPLTLSATVAMAPTGLVSGGAPQIPAIEILEKRLLLAAAHGDIKKVQQLLDLGVDPNKAKDMLGFTALHLAVCYNHLEIAEKLLAHGANLNAKNQVEATPLHLASKEGHPTIVATLLANGANPNLQDFEGVTPFHLVTFCGHPEVVENLLAYGADPHAINNEGYTPKDYLAHVKDPATKAAIAEMLEDAEKEWQKEHPAPTTLEEPSVEQQHERDKGQSTVMCSC